MEELAQSLEADTDALIEKWDGRPDLIIEDIFRVRDQTTKEIIDLELTNYQKKLVHAVWYGDEDTINVLKGRRTGYSFIACCVILLKATTMPHSFFAITGPSKSQAKDRIEDIYTLMDLAKISYNPVVDNRDEIKLPNEATMMAFSGSPDTSRGGDSADLLYIDEMDFLPDQAEAMRAFSPFVALGEATTLQISTPKLENGIFMQNQADGSPKGENGIISIEQPAFHNADEINPEVSLHEQNTDIAMPYLNLNKAERDRARDPDGFRQEYLCEPVENQYRFFDEETVDAALRRGDSESYVTGSTAGSQKGGKMVMSVDFAGGGKDETAVCVVEHCNSARYLRHREVITDTTLRNIGITPPKSRNPSAVAERIQMLYKANGIDKIITDATNMGEGFDSEIRETIGRGINSFNFSDRESVEEMMENVNYGFHNGQITLYPDDDDKLRDQILAIVKDKTNKGSIARYSGKDHAPEGRDDLAIALALALYPPNMSTGDKEVTEAETDEFDDIEQGDGPNRSNLKIERKGGDSDSKIAVSTSSSGQSMRNRDYNRRHERGRN